MTRFDPLFQQALADLARQDRLRRLRAFTPSGPAMLAAADGRRLIDFSSNDYLGLARHPLLAERAAEWAARYGAGAAASRLVSGTRAPHTLVEAKIAALKGCEAALTFASGWQANASLVPSLARLSAEQLGAPARFFCDRLNHASLHQGCAAAGVRQIRFRHNDLAHLATLMEARQAEPGLKVILTESVFSMDGDRADVAALTDLAERFGALLCIDEAHATGVIGPKGAGLASEAPGRVDLVMGTFSKALGGMGAFIAGSQALCDWMANSASGFIYSTAPPPAVMGAADAALDLLPELDEARASLAANAAALRAALAEKGLETGESTTQIVPVLAGPAARALRWTAALEAEGVLAIAIRPPTVPEGQSRLRVALSAAHDEAMMDTLTQALCRLADMP